MESTALCGLWGCKNRPALLPGRMSYKVTKPGLVSVLYLSMRCTVLLFIRAPFCCYVFYLLVVLVKLSVLAKWLARKTPLRKPNRGEGIVSRKLRPKNACDFLGLLYCFIVLLSFVLYPAPTWYNYFPTFMVRYSLFMLKVSLNPSKLPPPLSIWLHLFHGAGHEKRRGEQLKWTLAFRLYIGSFPCAQLSGPVHTGHTSSAWLAECIFCVFSLGLCFVCSFVLFDLFVCPNCFMFPWAAESSPLLFLVLA